MPAKDASSEMTGRVVLITGGSSGIGLAAAKRFASAGARLVLLARGLERLEQAAKEIRSDIHAADVLPLLCDVTDEAAVIRAFAEALQSLERLDVVVSNAGGAVAASLEDTSLAAWNAMLSVHATAYFLVAREAVRVFRRQQTAGVIIFVASDNAVKPTKEFLAYNVAKAAELHMARCIAEEVGPSGTRINCVLPGAVFGSSSLWTPEFRQARAMTHGFSPERLEVEYGKNTALGVAILPEDVAEAIYFLASDRAGKISGTAINVDGGEKAAYLR